MTPRLMQLRRQAYRSRLMATAKGAGIQDFENQSDEELLTKLEQLGDLIIFQNKVRNGVSVNPEKEPWFSELSVADQDWLRSVAAWMSKF